MRNRIRNWKVFVILLIVLLSATACKPWTVVKNSEVQGEDGIEIFFENKDFDSTNFAKEIWDKQIFEYYEENQVSASILVKELREDPEQAGSNYGIGINDIGRKWQFILGGKAQILEVDTASRAGVLVVDIEPYDTLPDLTIQIGPVIKGTTLRDSFPEIKLDDFSNQVEFASISKAFNELVVSQVIGDMNFSEMVGKEITFLGAFSYENVDTILVTPILIEY